MFFRRGRQAGEVGETSQEAQVVGNDRRNLRLLQHDLGQPDPVRIAGSLPRQIVAARYLLPLDHSPAKRRRFIFGNRHQNSFFNFSLSLSWGLDGCSACPAGGCAPSGAGAARLAGSVGLPSSFDLSLSSSLSLISAFLSSSFCLAESDSIEPKSSL